MSQLTTSPQNHVLTNTAVWSPDSNWIVYDTRPDPAGSVFEGDRIERINVRTREVQLLHQSRHDAHCGVVTHHPHANQILFIQGPEHPTPDYAYAPNRRQGILLDLDTQSASNLDARNLTPPFTPGALRGGSHVHVFHPTAPLVSFTYNDDLVTPNQRNVGVSLLNHPVHVPAAHPRNHDGQAFSVLVTRTTATPRPGSDEIARAFEDAWVGPTRSLAFVGEILTDTGQRIHELFIADLPDDLTSQGDHPLAGTPITLPAPPRGTAQRRLTYTAARKFPGLATSPRHWPRASPDGQRIAFLMPDDRGVTQLWTVRPTGGPPTQLTANPHPITSAFTWSPTGQHIAHTMDHGVCLTNLTTGNTRRLTDPTPECSPRPEAVVLSPDGRSTAYARTIEGHNQIVIASCA